jgi:hypothetical protein
MINSINNMKAAKPKLIPKAAICFSVNPNNTT